MKYKRILLKLSGEALAGEKKTGFDEIRLNEYAAQIRDVAQLGVEIGIVVGGGNIFRGLSGVNRGFDRVKGDSIGMLATVINSIAIQSALEDVGQKARVLTTFNTEPLAERYSKVRANEAFTKGEVVIFGGGTGNPFFTTDSASALKGVEINANVLLKGTRVDGVYTADPEKDPSAKKYDTLTFDEAYDKELKIMDLTAFTLCSENNLPIVVFDMNKTGNLKKIVTNQPCGTLITK